MSDKVPTRQSHKGALRTEDTELSVAETAFVNSFINEGGLMWKAAQAAGSKAKDKTGLSVVGSLIYKRPNVQKRIREIRARMAEAAGIDEAWLLENLKEVAHKCLQKVPVLEWNGEEWVESGEWKFDSTGANKAFELIGKHIGFFEKDNNSKRAAIQINIDTDDAGL